MRATVIVLDPGVMKNRSIKVWPEGHGQRGRRFDRID